ncbi:MAG: zinc-binding alcohol dehydrogenase family protein [Thermonemataceae bacterium]
MRQIVLPQFGTPEVLQMTTAQEPQPKKAEVLLKVEAVGVNFSDILRRKNTYFMPTPLPYVLGTEAVGIITELGDQVPTHLQKGDRVLAILPAGGGYAEYVVAPAQYCVPLPTQVKSEDATAIFVQGTTAYLLLHKVAKEVAGKTVLIHAAAGGVGSLLVQLAKVAGARVIAAASTAEKLQKAQALGADLTVNYTQPNWTNTLIDNNQGEKVDFIFEMVGGKVYEQSIEALKPGGSMIVYGAASGEKGLLHSERFVDENQHLLSFNLAHYVQHKTEAWQAALGAMIEQITSGNIRIQTPHTYTLEEAVQAHQAVEQRKTIGKVVLVMN